MCSTNHWSFNSFGSQILSKTLPHTAETISNLKTEREASSTLETRTCCARSTIVPQSLIRSLALLRSELQLSRRYGATSAGEVLLTKSALSIALRQVHHGVSTGPQQRAPTRMHSGAGLRRRVRVSVSRLLLSHPLTSGGRLDSRPGAIVSAIRGTLGTRPLQLLDWSPRRRP